MLLHSTAGPLVGPNQSRTPIARGGLAPVPAGTFGEPMLSRYLPDYYHLTKARRVWSVFTSEAQFTTPFNGDVAGTPIFGFFNPPGSGADFVPLFCSVHMSVSPAVVNAQGFNFWGADQQSSVTGVQTIPLNVYDGLSASSAVRAMVNVVNTGANGSNFLLSGTSIGAQGNAAIPPTITPVWLNDFNGVIVMRPGSYFAMGCVDAFVGGSIQYDATFMWAELPA